MGERVLLFLARRSDGSLRTNQLALGKFELRVDASGATLTRRQLPPGARMMVPTGVELPPQTVSLEDVRNAVRVASGSTPTPGVLLEPSEMSDPGLRHASVTETGFELPKARFFEPDEGIPVP